MRRLFAIFFVLLVAGFVISVASCSGSGGRRSLPLPPSFFDFYPEFTGADSGMVNLTVMEGAAYYNGESDLGAFDDTTGGGFAFVDEQTYFYGLDANDTNGDGFMDWVAVSMRALPAEAINTPYASGYALIGGADYLPHELGVGGFIFYLPINQAFANVSSVEVATWVPGGSWHFFGTFPVSLHPDQTKFPNFRVIEIRDYLGNLGALGVFIPYHSQGS